MVLKVTEEKRQLLTKASKTRQRVRGRNETWSTGFWLQYDQQSPWCFSLPDPSDGHQLPLLSYYLLRPWVPPTSSLSLSPSSLEISNFPSEFVRDAVSCSDSSWPPAELWLCLNHSGSQERFPYSHRTGKSHPTEICSNWPFSSWQIIGQPLLWSGESEEA